MRSLARGLEFHRRTVEKQTTRSGVFHSGKNFHQRRLASAILAYEDINSASIDGEIHLVERYGPGESLGDFLGDHNDLMRFRSVLLIRGFHKEMT